MKTQHRNRRYLLAVIGGIIVLMLGIEYIGLRSTAKAQANQTANVLVDQIGNVLRNNEKKEQALVDSLKEEYIVKAKAVAYIIDNNPRTETDIAELIRIATLMSIDEIHLFNESGTIYGGTVPPYYGYSFDSGEQMAYFKPMLENKSLSMCQDVTPNTAEGKAMMYAICWNDAGTRMLQIGIEPRRLLAELHSNEISEVISAMPAYDGVDILVADRESGEIKGATDARWVGGTLDAVGIDLTGADLSAVYYFKAPVARRNMYCAASALDDYVIVVAQERAVVEQSIPIVLVSVFAYLLLAALVIMLVVQRMMDRVLREQQNAITDPMTGFFNRRAYENDMAAQGEGPYEKNFAYFSADLNGLKVTNDTLGHEAGDELIRGAAQCLRQCFGNYGKLYRIGGDEFVALVFCDEVQMEDILQDVTQVTEEWSRRSGRKLSVACGGVRAEERPQDTLSALARLADERMYEAKTRYYRENCIDRRHHREKEE